MPQDGRRSTCSVQLLLVLPLVLLQCHRSSALPKELADELQKIWEDNRHLTDDDVAQLRQDSWNMFNKGFTNYMALAFPKDNLLPVSCAGENWQGGMAVTLLDALDSLMMMGRLSDMRAVLPMIKEHVDFRKPIKVHVFEVVIRVVGGLLSGHSLLQRAADIIPEYDGVLLDLATQLAEAMLPAFHTPSGLPFQFTNLKTGPVTDVRTTCTACVGTLLLEYGTLSALHGDPRWRQLAEHAAHALYARRSSLGLVGSSLDVGTSTWVSREATIGPGSDSFYEYMLKSYLMFGNRTHLEMFTNLYTSAMRHLQVPGTLRGYSFLADVHMDSGRMSRPFVSSLGAFWPGMQALVGQLDDAIDLHANFTAAWQLWGWLPELFGLDLARVHPEDPGYNLRPEHIESTFMLYAQTGQHKYRKIAARMQRTLEAANQAACGYTSVSNVETGAQNDLQESFFLSETVKYLYLSFTPHAPHLLDYYVLSTEGHILPTFPPNNSLQEAEEEGDLARVRLEGLPPNCVAMCEPIDEIKQAAIEAGLRQSFPLLSFRRAEAVAIKRRRCIACVAVTKHMAAHPPASVSARTRIMQLNADLQSHGALSNNKALAQAVCVLRVSRQGAVSCHVLRPIVAHDIQHGLPHNAVVLQLTWVENTAAAGLLLVTPITPQDKASLILPASTATFGGSLLEITPNCIRHLYNVTWPWMRATAHANRTRHCPAPPVRSHDPGARTRAAWRHLLRTYTARTAKPTLPELSVPGLALSHQVLAAQQGQVSSCQAHKEKPSSTAKSTSTAVDSPPDPNPEPNPNSATSPDPIPDTNPAPSPLLSPEEGQGRVHPVIQTLPDTASCKVAAQRAIPQSATTISTKTTITTTISANGAQAAAAGQPTTHVVTSTITTSTAVGGHEPACVAVEEALGAEVLLLDPSNSDPTLVDTVKDEAMLESFEEDQTLKACPMLADSSGTPGGARLAVPLDIMTDQPGPVQTEVQAEVPPGVQAPDTKTTPEAPRISEECVDESDAEADTRFDDPHVTGPCKTVPVPYGELVLASPLFACSSEFSNAAMLSGSVAVVVRGGCSFATKALAVQAAGAHAMVVLDLHGTDQELLTMSGDVGMTSHAVRIPALLVGGAHSRTLLRAMRDAALAGQPRLVASLSLDPNQPGDGASGSVPSHDGVSPSRGTTSIYMLVPTNSHAYVKANLLEQGMDMQTLLDAVLQDERVMLLLMQIAKENEATLAAQAASMGMGAGTA